MSLLPHGDRRLPGVRAVVGRARARQSVPRRHRRHDGGAAQPAGRTARDHGPSEQTGRRLQHYKLALVTGQQHWLWQHAPRPHLRRRLLTNYERSDSSFPAEAVLTDVGGHRWCDCDYTCLLSVVFCSFTMCELQ